MDWNGTPTGKYAERDPDAYVEDCNGECGGNPACYDCSGDRAADEARMAARIDRIYSRKDDEGQRFGYGGAW